MVILAEVLFPLFLLALLPLAVSLLLLLVILLVPLGCIVGWLVSLSRDMVPCVTRRKPLPIILVIMLVIVLALLTRFRPGGT